MNAFTGMDIAQVRSLARQMSDEAIEIRRLLQALTHELEGAPWDGVDRQRFVSEWNSRHAKALDRVERSLRDAAAQANEYARRQEAASRS